MVREPKLVVYPKTQVPCSPSLLRINMQDRVWQELFSTQVDYQSQQCRRYAIDRSTSRLSLTLTDLCAMGLEM